MKRVSKLILLALVAVPVVSIVSLKLWVAKEDLEFDGSAWAYRSKYYSVKGDGCALLDKNLGASSARPAELLNVLAWKYDKDPGNNPFNLGFPDFFDVQHQALVRLLALQQKNFGISPPPPTHGSGGMDHTGASLTKIENGIFVVSGSASVYPDSFDDHPWEGYFRWETFRFDRDGKFISRSPSAE